MDATTRQSAIQAIADALVEVPESQVDTILREADGNEDQALTPQGWGYQEPASRRLDLVRLLQRRPDSVLEALLVFVPVMPLELKGEEPETPSSRPVAAADRSTKSIFVVHGHARAELYEAMRVLERATGLEVVILHEQPSAGRTILEKFEDYAVAASYAVVLLTADDVGRAESAVELRLRGRQNVVFELGFFFGKLGRDKVAVLLGEGVEEPSDIEGLVYIILDSAGAWKQKLAHELRAAGIPVNYERIP